jgi:hypothetical protein
VKHELVVCAWYASGASSQSASRLVTRSAGKLEAARKPSSSGNTGRTWETPTFSVALVAYMSITGIFVPGAR